MGDVINVGSLVADLDLDTSRLDRGVMNAEMGLLAVKKSMMALDDALMSGKIGLAEYTKQALMLAEAENDLNNAILTGLSATGAQAAALAKSGASWNNYANAAKSASASANNATNQMANGWARAGMQFGYMVDDIQYGFSSIVNNVAPLTQSLAQGLGASAAAANAWGAGVQIAAVGVYQLYHHWDDFLKLLEIPVVRTEAEEMENLADKTKRTADETERLNKYKREQAEIKSLLDSRSDEQEGRAKDVKHAITEAGGKKVIGEMAKGMGASMTPEEQAEIRDLEDRIAGKGPAQFTGMLGENEGATDNSRREDDEKKRNIALLEARRKQIQDRINDENGKRAGDLAVDAETDVGALKSMIAKVRKNPKAFPDGLAKSLEAELPENREKRKQALIDAQGNKNIRKFEIEQAKEGEKYDDDKFEEDIRARQEAVRRRDAKKRQGVRQVKEDSAGIDSIAENLAAGMMTGTVSPQGALKQIQNILKSNDTTYAKEGMAAQKTPGLADDVKAKDRADERAELAAKEILKDAGGDLKKKVIDESLNPSRDEEQRKVSQSQQFDAGQLAAKVQAGVNDEDKQERKKQTSFLDQAVKHLAVIAKNGGGNPWAGFQEK